MTDGPGWNEVYDQLSAADRQAPLPPAELERLSIAAYLTGHDADSLDALARAHNASVAAGDVSRTIRSAFWLGFILMNRGERARAAGWLARAERLLEQADGDRVERGYLLLPKALQQVGAGDFQSAETIFSEAARIGEHFNDADLVNLARQGRGRTLIALGEIDRGVALLDEVMVAATSGELSPIITGTVYCSVVSACFELFDVRRAQEWTEALNRWCASQRGVVPYRGECLVHRAEIMRLHGGWLDAIEEARRACECLSRPPSQPALGAAFYQLAEVHRLRGEFDKAEEAYRLSAEAGRMPQPGLALLRLVQGRTDAARSAIARVLEESRDRRVRSRMLDAAVEILLAAGDVVGARAAADELATVAAALGTPLLAAMSKHASGAVLLAEDDPKGALAALRTACEMWRDLGAPYESARTGVLIGRACRALGDVDSAQLELIAAARVFRELGAAPDLQRLERVSSQAAAPSDDQLTARELQVLKLIAAGKSNRAIADELRISEKTVARHVSNIFTKLDLPNRSAATAYAFRQRLV